MKNKTKSGKKKQLRLKKVMLRMTIITMKTKKTSKQSMPKLENTIKNVRGRMDGPYPTPPHSQRQKKVSSMVALLSVKFL